MLLKPEKIRKGVILYRVSNYGFSYCAGCKYDNSITSNRLCNVRYINGWSWTSVRDVCDYIYEKGEIYSLHNHSYIIREKKKENA